MEVARSEVDLETIVLRIRRDELDLQPDFQRGEIWDNKRRQRLVDSLLRNWYVPAVHFIRDTSTGPDIVLDGQQRLAAIRDFFDDKFAVDGLIEPLNDEVQALHGLKYSKLPDGARRSLNRFALPCVTLKRFEPGEPNELFFRLNQSYNLTPPEKRNALHGPARLQVKSLVSNLEDSGLLEQATVGFSNGRLAYDDIVARTCLAIERGDLTRHINNDVVERFYRESEFSPDTIHGVFSAGETLLSMLQSTRIKTRLNKGTLFSWLVFCYWAPRVLESALPAGFLDHFENNRRALKQGEEVGIRGVNLSGALALYDDRSAYRVTDVSSVLARDCVLYLYLSVAFSAPSINGISSLIGQLEQSYDSRAENLILEFVVSSGWGRLEQLGS